MLTIRVILCAFLVPMLACENAQLPPNTEKARREFAALTSFVFYATRGKSEVFDVTGKLVQTIPNTDMDGVRFVVAGDRGTIFGNAGTAPLEVQREPNVLRLIEKSQHYEHQLLVFPEPVSLGFKARYLRTINSNLVGETMRSVYEGYVVPDP